MIRIKTLCCALYGAHVFASATARAQTDPLELLFQQQSTVARGIVAELKAPSVEQRLFGLRLANLLMGTTVQSSLFAFEDAVAEGALSALGELVASDNHEVADLARRVQARIVAELELEQAVRSLPILQQATTEALAPHEYETWLAVQTRPAMEYRIQAGDCRILRAVALDEQGEAALGGGVFVDRGFSFVSTTAETAKLRVRTAQCGTEAGIAVSAGLPREDLIGGSTAETARPISAGGSYLSQLAEQGSHWMSLAAVAGQSILIEVAPTTDALDTYLAIYDRPDAPQLAGDDDSGVGFGSRLEFTSARDGDVLVNVRNLADERGEYELTVRAMASPRERSQPVVVGERYSSELSGGAVDWWAFTPEQGRRYRVDADPREDGESLDTVLELFDQHGVTLVAQNDDGGNGLGSRLSYRSEAGAPVLMRVRALDNGAGAYEFSVVADDLALDHATPSVATGAYRGALSGGVVDASWWRLLLPAGRYAVEVDPSARLDSQIELYAADELTLLDYDDDGGDGLGSRLEFTVTGEEVRLLKVSAVEDGMAGEFALEVTRLRTMAEDAPQAERGGEYRADIKAGGERWWKLETTAETRYEFEALPANSVDTVLTLYGEDASTIIDSDDDGGRNGGSLLEYLAPEDGTVFIRVSGFDDSSGRFSLRVR